MNRFSLRTPLALSVACCLILAGCGAGHPMTKANYDKIQEGMTIEQVSEIMGFPPPDWDQTSIIPGSPIRATNGNVDREVKTTLEGETYDDYSYKEMGGTNKKEMHLRYENNKLVQKSQAGME